MQERKNTPIQWNKVKDWKRTFLACTAVLFPSLDYFIYIEVDGFEMVEEIWVPKKTNGFWHTFRNLWLGDLNQVFRGTSCD